MSISTDYTTQIIQQAKNAWTAQNKTVTKFFNKYDDAVYQKEIAPGRNRAVYLLGHLIAVNDGMIKLFGIGDRLYADLDETFIKAADKTVEHIPSVSELKQHWETLNEALTKRFDEMTTTDWMGKHTAVSEEDFVKEPLRNKLNVLIGRTNHQSYHMGQLALISA
jgi:uncharacterized damage-inducible protein DinB